MSEIKISDELLSLVFENKCGFKQVLDNEIFFSSLVCELEKIECVNYYGFDNSDLNAIDYCYYVNLHTFIHLAKIKAWECGYEVVELGITCSVHKEMRHLILFENLQSSDKFLIDNVLKAIEWVAEQVGAKSETN